MSEIVKAMYALEHLFRKADCHDNPKLTMTFKNARDKSAFIYEVRSNLPLQYQDTASLHNLERITVCGIDIVIEDAIRFRGLPTTQRNGGE